MIVTLSSFIFEEFVPTWLARLVYIEASHVGGTLQSVNQPKSPKLMNNGDTLPRICFQDVKTTAEVDAIFIFSNISSKNTEATCADDHNYGKCSRISEHVP